MAANATRYLTAVLEYLTVEILAVAVAGVEKRGLTNINSRSLYLAIAEDEELNSLIYHRLGMAVVGGGVVPYIARQLREKETDDD